MTMMKVSFQLGPLEFVKTVLLSDNYDYTNACETLMKIPVGELIGMRNEQEFMELHRKYRVKETVG